MINRERMLDHVLQLIQIDSHSREEREVALRLKADCEALGGTVLIDDAGEKVGGNTGNVIVHFKGTRNGDVAPIFLSAHMDTVVPGKGVKPIREGGIIRTDGTTVLGGDDKTGCSIIVETVRTLQEHKIPYGDIEVCFTICEEVGLLGAKNTDISRFSSTFGLVLDSDDPGHLITKAPSSNRMRFLIHGLEAHAGVAPEKGISAIKIAGEAIAMMNLGRIDHETTANIGLINGGVAVNVIPNRVELLCEARSHNDDKLENQTRHMIDCLHQVAARYGVELDGLKVSARVEEQVERDYHRMDVQEDSRIVQLVKRAAANLGHACEPLPTGGGCDANVFNRKGIECANLGTGMNNIHTVKEYLVIDDFYQSADVVLEVLKLHGQA
ncbi:MAG: M20/M25/M40 family metallo-hydrolase [Blastocatellia bacterium]|nr:M20/M25/M40 family metallo-hydrolase [Blastocatellia bacterium]